VLSASVTVNQEVVSSIGKGVLVFAAVAPGDTEKDMNAMATKVCRMKLWDDEAGSRVCLAKNRQPYGEAELTATAGTSSGRRV
jgi:D-Tyr-tRNAtyr deacylase